MPAARADHLALPRGANRIGAMFRRCSGGGRCGDDRAAKWLWLRQATLDGAACHDHPLLTEEL